MAAIELDEQLAVDELANLLSLLTKHIPHRCGAPGRSGAPSAR
jgi:hypothetical protein